MDSGLISISNKVDQLAQAWQKFKEKNEERLTLIESKNSSYKAESIIKQINEEINSLKQQISTLVQTKSADGQDLSASMADPVMGNTVSEAQGMDYAFTQGSPLAITTDDLTAGGGFIPHNLIRYIDTKLRMDNPIRQLSSIIRLSSNQAVDVTVPVDTYAEANWVNETQDRPTTSAPTMAFITIYAHEMYSQPKTSQRWLDDATSQGTKWLIGKIIQGFRHLENEAFFTGEQNQNKPRGILTFESGTSYDQIQQIETATADLSSDDIIKLYHSLDNQYIRNAAFIMHPSTLLKIRTLKYQGSGHYIWQPSNSSTHQETLMGVPVYLSSYMGAIEDAQKPLIALGDFKAGYLVVERQDIKLVKDNLTEKPFVKFYATKRVGGNVVNSSAIKLLALKPTTPLVEPQEDSSAIIASSPASGSKSAAQKTLSGRLPIGAEESDGLDKRGWKEITRPNLLSLTPYTRGLGTVADLSHDLLTFGQMCCISRYQATQSSGKSLF